MHVFKAAQPALLYLVPACLITPMLVALVCGDFKTLFRYVSFKNKHKNNYFCYKNYSTKFKVNMLNFKIYINTC